MNYLLIFIGGGLGSVCRYGISRLFSHFSTSIPFGTLTSNLLASILLGVIVYLIPKGENEWVPYLLVIGFCGGFSTFSTFSAENVQLFEQGQWALLTVNILLSLGAGFGVFLLISRINHTS